MKRGLTVGVVGVFALLGLSCDVAESTVTDVVDPRPDDEIPADTSGTALVAECDDPGSGWIWCDDFEIDRSDSYFEYVDRSGSFARVEGVGLGSSTGMRARWALSQVDAGALHLGIGRTPDAYRSSVSVTPVDYREVYWRLFVRYPEGWVGGGADKLSRVMVFHSPENWGQAMAAPVWSGARGPLEDYLVIDPVSGTDEQGVVLTSTYNDPGTRWLGAAKSDTPIFSSSNIGPWYCVEARVRLNDPGSANGTFMLWIDDDLEASRVDLNWVGQYDDYGINALFVENYWNSGAPAAQERYIDNLVVSTERIGCS